MAESLERVSPEAVGVSSHVIQRWLDALEQTGTEMHSFMLARHGKVCAEGWWQPYAPPLLHSQQSLTKTYAVTALGALYDEGLLSLDEKVAEIFEEQLPEEPCERLKRMTVRHLLSMSSGIRGAVDIGGAGQGVPVQRALYGAWSGHSPQKNGNGSHRVHAPAHL